MKAKMKKKKHLQVDVAANKSTKDKIFDRTFITNKS